MLCFFSNVCFNNMVMIRGPSRPPPPKSTRVPHPWKKRKGIHPSDRKKRPKKRPPYNESVIITLFEGTTTGTISNEMLEPCRQITAEYVNVHIIIPSGVTTIGEGAFKDCKRLKVVEFQD